MSKKGDIDYREGYYRAHRDYYLKHGKGRGIGVDYKTASEWAQKDVEFIRGILEELCKEGR